MKFTVSRDEFYQAITATQRATATRVIQPILSNILIESLPSETHLKLAATDLDFAIETQVPALIQTPGRTTLSAKKLVEIVSKLPAGSQILFDIHEPTQNARIECGASIFDIRTLPADEFPVIKVLDQENFLEVNLKTLLRAITQTAFAAASYETNNVLGGVFFQLSSDLLEMAATDGSRLARRREAVPAEKNYRITESISAIIPVKALQEFARLAGAVIKETAKDKTSLEKDKNNEEKTPEAASSQNGSEAVQDTIPPEITKNISKLPDEPVRIAIQDSQISFRTKRFYVVSRLLDGQYPKYQQLIPADNKIVAYANRRALIESLERAAVMANERTNVVKMTFDKGNLSLAANTPDLGDSKDTMEVHYEGEPLNIAFNYKYILDALRVIESDDVRLETNGALAPTLFKSKEENNYFCLVMPVQVK